MGIFSKIFGSDKKKIEKTISEYTPVINTITISDDEYLERKNQHLKKITPYYLEQITQSSFIKKDCIKIVLSHFKFKTNLNKGTKLTADEKRSLGINTRLSITKELIEVLTEQGVKQKNPKDVLKKLHCQATFNHSRDNDITRFKKIGIKKYKFKTSIDGRDCYWCEEQNNKEFDISVNINKLIKNNCSCYGHCRGIMLAVLS